MQKPKTELRALRARLTDIALNSEDERAAIQAAKVLLDTGIGDEPVQRVKPLDIVVKALTEQGV